ncbi:MAG: hypothetical protein KF773_32225 [Deltaproteobacteria bacterium]|nr:hypothetical protein [Deltaproteobacteria bacterium]MCW5807514.1 hypothetical protein [Deltaproteobacteria bacterium]
MMTWDDVVAHVRARFAVIDAGDEHVVVGWKAGGGVHAQRLDLATAFGAPWLRVASSLGDRAAAHADTLMSHNATLAIGALAFDGDTVVLHHLTPLALLVPDHLELVVKQIAHEAVRLRVHGLRTQVRAGLDEFHFYA